MDGQRARNGAVVQQRNGKRTVDHIVERLTVARGHEKAAVGVKADVLQVRRGILALIALGRKGQVCAGARVAERKVELSVVKRRGDLLDRLVLGEVKRLDRRLAGIRMVGRHGEALMVGGIRIQPRAARIGAVAGVVFNDGDVQQRRKLRIRVRERNSDRTVVIVLDLLDRAQAAGIEARGHGGANGIGRVLCGELVPVVKGALGIDGERPCLTVVAAPLRKQAGLGLKSVGELRERLVHETADGEVIGILCFVRVHAGGRAVVERELSVKLDGGLRVLFADGLAGIVRVVLAAGGAAEQQRERQCERQQSGQMKMFHGLPPWVTG